MPAWWFQKALPVRSTTTAGALVFRVLKKKTNSGSIMNSPPKRQDTLWRIIADKNEPPQWCGGHAYFRAEILTTVPSGSVHSIGVPSVWQRRACIKSVQPRMASSLLERPQCSPISSSAHRPSAVRSTSMSSVIISPPPSKGKSYHRSLYLAISFRNATCSHSQSFFAARNASKLCWVSRSSLNSYSPCSGDHVCLHV